MPAPDRHRDAREGRFDLSEPTRDDPTRVVCPVCRSGAFVVPVPEKDREVRVACHTCGFSKTSDGSARRFAWNAENPTDGYFGLDLWLRARCGDHTLWAFNRRHLDLLESYVSASLRERERDDRGWRNASVVSRLPKWMTASANREEVLKAIRALREQI